MIVISPEQMSRLNQLWNAGLSAVECGAELGLGGETGDVREAVLRAIEGVKAYPGLKAMKAKAAKSRRPARSNVPGGAEAATEDGDGFFPADNFAPPREGVEFDAAIPLEQRRKSDELTSSTCHWPVGDPKDPAFFFCGGETYRDPGGEELYCGHHCLRAYNGHLHRRKAA